MCIKSDKLGFRVRVRVSGKVKVTAVGYYGADRLIVAVRR